MTAWSCIRYTEEEWPKNVEIFYLEIVKKFHIGVKSGPQSPGYTFE